MAFLLQQDVDLDLLGVQDLELLTAVASCPSIPRGLRRIPAMLPTASNLLRWEKKTLFSTAPETT